MIKTTFIYKGSKQPPPVYETFAIKIINIIKSTYSLPNPIEIQFEEMGPNVYGMTMLDPRFPNRIRINQDLSLEDYILPLTHELLHLHQIHTNRLQTRAGGKILWDGDIYKIDSLSISYNDYTNLPWEIDVSQKQKKILEFLSQNKKILKKEHLPKKL